MYPEAPRAPGAPGAWTLRQMVIVMNIHRLIALSILLASLVGTVLCQSAENEKAGITPSLTVADQTAVGDSMVGPSRGGGWIHSCR